MRSISALLTLAVLVPSYASAASCIWFADTQSIKQVNTDDSSIVAEVAIATPRRLVMNDTDCSVWALRNNNGRLLKFDPAGTQVHSLNVVNLDPLLTGALRIRLDPFDDTLWVAGDRRIVHLDASAAGIVAAFNAPGDIRRLRLGLDQNLWVLGKRKLWRFNRQGALIEDRPLDTAFVGEAKYFAVDELRDTIWIAGETQVARTSASAPGAAVIVVHVADGTTGFALDPITGRVWFGRPGSIEALSPDGTPFIRVDLAPLGLTGLHKLRFDPASRSLWAGFSQQLARFSDVGEPVAIVAAVDYDDEAIGVPPFKVRPRVSLERPPENGIVDRRRPVFELQYNARCNGSNCEAPQTYFSSMELSASLNGAQIGTGFSFDPLTNKTTFRPETALAEGLSSFTARLTDRFGHKSNPIDTTFTVDTIAPVFGPIKPPAGTVVANPQVNLRGSINEAGSTVTLQNAQALNPQGANPQSPQPPDLRFSWGLTLQPGSNSVQLSAIDPAGNVSTVTHTLTFNGGGVGTGAPQITVQSPVAGAAIADDQVSVGGTWSGPTNTGITVNGVIAALSGNQFFAAVPLVPGANTLTIVATAPGGASATSTVQVTSSGPAPTRVVASALQGFAPLNVSFTVTSDRPIESVEGNFAVGFQICAEGFCFEAGSFFVSPVTVPLVFTYEQPGTYQAVFNVRHTDGTTVTKTLRIVVQDPQQLDQLLQATWNSFTQALVARDKVAAMKSLTASAQARYGRVFDALQTSLPAVAASVSAPEPGLMTSTVGEYFLTRQAPDGSLRLFLIYFIRDADGVWRLDTM